MVSTHELKKTNILDAAIGLANEVRLELLKIIDENTTIFEESIEAYNLNIDEFTKFKLGIMNNNEKIMKVIDKIDNLQDSLTKHYHSDSYDTFYNRALLAMHSMEGEFMNETGFSFS